MKIKTLQLLAILTFIAFLTTGCIIVVHGSAEEGSGNIITEKREVSEFNKVHLKGSGNVVLTQGEQQSLQIKTDDNIMPLIETTVSGEKLTISHGNHHLRPTSFEVYITLENIEGVGISGSGDIIGKGRFVTDTLYAEISGSGDMDLEVETGLLETKISGSGSIHLSGKAEDYTVSISGSGKINAFDVDAKGRPQINTKISGSGSLKSRD
jgi:hypothetical protein